MMIRDIVEQASGSEIVAEMSRGSFTFEIDVASEGEKWITPKNLTRGGNRKIGVDELHVELL